VWHDAFTCVTWLIRMCDMTNSPVWHDPFACVAWLIRVCDIQPERETERENKSCHPRGWGTSHIWMSRVTHLDHTYEWIMSHIWIRPVTLINVTHMGWGMSHMWMSHVTYGETALDANTDSIFFLKKKLNYTFLWGMIVCRCVCVCVHMRIHTHQYAPSDRHTHR